jgi:hypothetical protein
MGALAHYASDIAGHPAVNLSVAIEYPNRGCRAGACPGLTGELGHYPNFDRYHRVVFPH